MCYSAMVYAEHRKFQRETGSTLDIASYVRLFWTERGKDPTGKRPRAPRAVERDLLEHGPPELAELVREWDTREIRALEQEIFAQRKRVADAERKLRVKPTKAAQNDVRIGTDKVARALARLADLRRREPEDRDYRIYPGSYAPVIVSEGGKRVVKPMRYQCRPAGKPAFYDSKFPGTYNARRDSLDGFWKPLFGHSHGVMVATRFYENVPGADGRNRVLEFIPRDGAPMLIACLWSRWTDPTGVEPELLSFAAITDEPQPEVAAAGHDRTIINLKPEHLDAWLDPRGDVAAMMAILDDKARPYYEHREAA
ncbi:MAG TPA: SOS response-associated peptidase family protein [Luteimonas sp.]|jgi:putative SOS response-associated peptidase YedK|nr:SOS response-associated peptidase family protein [Luteimonas sp.]